MTIGTVVAEANGQPIYADKVLPAVDPELSAKARLDDMNESKFRVIAAGLLKEQIDSEIVEELEFAAAEPRRHRGREADGLRRHHQLAAEGDHQGRRQRRRRPPASTPSHGRDFDEEVRQQYRKFLVHHPLPEADLPAGERHRRRPAGTTTTRTSRRSSAKRRRCGSA